MPLALAGHTVNPSLRDPWRHGCRQGSRKRRGRPGIGVVSNWMETRLPHGRPPCGSHHRRIRQTLTQTGLKLARHCIRTATSCAARPMHTDHLERSLPARPRGTFGSMDAATAPAGRYLRRVPRGQAGKDPAAKPQICRSDIELSWPSGSLARLARIEPDEALPPKQKQRRVQDASLPRRFLVLDTARSGRRHACFAARRVWPVPIRYGPSVNPILSASSTPTWRLPATFLSSA